MQNGLVQPVRPLATCRYVLLDITIRQEILSSTVKVPLTVSNPRERRSQAIDFEQAPEKIRPRPIKTKSEDVGENRLRAQLPFIKSVKLRSSLATLALAFASMAL
jgi:hypothetical protein